MSRFSVVRRPLGILGLFLGAAGLHGQTVVDSVLTTFTAGSMTSEKLVGTKIPFENDTLAITSMTDANGNIYTAGTMASAAYIRTDNTSTGELSQTTAWYMGNSAAASNSAPTSVSGDYQNGTDSLLLQNNVLEGSYNLFANSSATSANQGNIERVDIVYNGSTGITATDTLAIGVFDLGTSANFSIAVITGVNASGKPTSYGGNLLTVPATDFTSANLLTTSNVGTSGILNAPGSSPTDYLLRYDSSTALGTAKDVTDNENVTSNLSAVVFTMADLGISSGTTIYGYSLMAGDVTDAGNINNLVSYSNSAYFATNTPDTEAFNPAAVNGVIFTMHIAPEPSAYAEVFLAATLALYGWKRRPIKHSV